MSAAPTAPDVSASPTAPNVSATPTAPDVTPTAPDDPATPTVLDAQSPDAGAAGLPGAGPELKCKIIVIRCLT
jgi:hypothetical protein